MDEFYTILKFWRFAIKTVKGSNTSRQWIGVSSKAAKLKLSLCSLFKI